MQVFESRSIRYEYQTRGAQAKQLDEGVGDTFVLFPTKKVQTMLLGIDPT